MLLLLNVLWVLFGGLVIALEYLVAGVVLCLTLIGIPFGIQCFKLAGLALWPFGRESRAVPRRGAGEAIFGSLFNILWFIFAGIWIFLSHLVIAVGLMITIIGIPFAFQHLKLAGLALLPFGREIRDIP
ncbi:MAG: YccF domain-containing protein [Nannocystaceae bacterium]